MITPLPCFPMFERMKRKQEIWYIWPAIWVLKLILLEWQLADLCSVLENEQGSLSQIPYMPHISPGLISWKNPLEVSFIAKAKISLVLLAFLICWQRIFSSLPAHPLVFPGPSVGYLTWAPSSFTLVTPSNTGQFCPPVAVLCMVPPWNSSACPLLALGSPFSTLLHWPFSPSCALLCTVSRWADSPEHVRLRHTKSTSLVSEGCGGGRRWGRWCIFTPLPNILVRVRSQ